MHISRSIVPAGSTICAAFLCFIFFSVSAQIQPTGAGVGVNLADHMLIKYADKTLYGKAEERIDGSPYLSEEFTKGIIYSDRGRYIDVMMRYNVFADHLEFMQNNTVYILDTNPKVMLKAELGDQTIVVDQIETRMPPGLFILLDSGKITLLLKKVILFREKQEPKAIETSGKPARYAPAPDLMYYKIGNDKLMKVTSIKKMIETFPDHKQEMSEFAKEKKIGSKNPRNSNYWSVITTPINKSSPMTDVWCLK